MTGIPGAVPPLAGEPTVTHDDVRAAAERIGGLVRRTPVLPPSERDDPAAWLKCEFLQHTGVFKVRGALNLLLAARERGELAPGRGVVIASGGNAGLATAYAASTLGVTATVFVPSAASPVKLARLRGYGAEVRVVGSEYAHAAEAAEAFAADTGALRSHAYDLPDVVAGAGTLALELAQDVPDLDTVVVAVGGGGLFAGIAAALQGRARIVAVEPASAPTLRSAIEAGQPVDVAVGGVAVDSLGARRVGAIAWSVARRTGPVSVLVADEDIVRARHRLWRDHRIAAEAGAATAYAALLAGAHVPAAGEKTAVVLCGANTDPATLEDPTPG